MKIKMIALPVMFVALAASSLWAQGPAPQPAVPPATGAAEAKTEPVVLEPTPGGYTYNPQGRRDPFMSLLRKATAEENTRVREKGLKGFLIQEIALKGIIKDTEGNFLAFFQAADGKSYWGRAKDRLFDGEIIAIDAANVMFRQEVADPLSPARTKEVKKSLYMTEEATQ
jgi:Tfp pilus assembly protein PilP